MKFYFRNEGGKVVCQTRTGQRFEYRDPVVNADRLVDHFEREQLGGRFKITQQWRIVP